jgi:predicted HicB family RNase H-like nuclease
MRRKATQKEVKGPVKMVQIALPEDLHTLVKIKATEQHLTLKAYVIETLEASVREGGEAKKK